MPSNVLPPSWTVTTTVENMALPAVMIGSPNTYGFFARRTTYVRNSLGELMASSGDEGDARNQGLAYCQQAVQPYDSATWPFP
jgi:hypothetical protein